MALIDYEEAARGYQAARGLDLGGSAPWKSALSQYIASGDPAPVLDLGAGTGQWTIALRTWFAVNVVAVEPSRAMREVFRSTVSGAQMLVAGRAERLPLGNATCQAAWVSTVVHHIGDLEAAAAELRRVVIAGGRVLIRGVFPGRAAGVTLFRYFPEAEAVVTSRYPTIKQVVARFAAAGFGFERMESVRQVSAPGLGSSRARFLAGRRSDTTLRLIGDEAFARGLARVDEDIAQGRGSGPVVDALDLLVLR